MKRYRDEQWLKKQYWEKDRTQREIADECGVSARTIRRHMNDAGIETREIAGENHPLHGEDRPESVKERIASSLDGRELSKQTRQRLAEAHRGRSLSEAVRERISASLTGSTKSERTRERMSESTAGEQNPNWKGGYSRRYGPGWATARSAVRERDGVCQYCGHDGSERRLEVHHIAPVRQFRNDPESDLRDAHDLDNLVLLCRRCHGKAEHGKIDISNAPR
ncbi:hypothetical protein GJ629_03985 [Halapricum sp. CBA1109]|uniref:HNH endonuclease n=1 Tax=Halapricum sp. CBA1109 TaxID=2668068 RepID=UPI0012F93E95|nr:hypothetical protein [Halapricum sp. CBA1109]